MREEILIAIVMLGISIIGSVITRNDKKWSVAFLLLAAVAGSLTAGMGVRFREIVEGPFGFLDSALCICAAAVFVGILNHAGAFDALLDAISRLRCKTAKALLVLLVIALPAMLTGLASVSVLTTGTLVGKRMKQQGVSNEKSAAIVVVGAFLGMILPPNCLPAMIAANGAGSVLPTPYVGFFVPLALMGIPSLILFACMNRNALALEPAEAKDKKTLLLVLLALVGAAVLVDGLLSSFVYIGGLTLVFTVASILALAVSFSGCKAALDTVSNGLMLAIVPVALMLALGSFVEVSSMSGVRGIFSLYILPYSTTAVMLVLMAVSMVLGLGFSVPIPAFLITYAVFPIGWLANTVIVTGISAALSIAYLLPLRGGLIAETRKALDAENVSWRAVMKAAAIPAALVLIIGVLMVIFGDSMKFLIL